MKKMISFIPFMCVCKDNNTKGLFFCLLICFADNLLFAILFINVWLDNAVLGYHAYMDNTINE